MKDTTIQIGSRVYVRWSKLLGTVTDVKDTYGKHIRGKGLVKEYTVLLDSGREDTFPSFDLQLVLEEKEVKPEHK